MRFALVEKATGLVRNVIIWDGGEFLPPQNYYVVKSDACDVDCYYDQKRNTFFNKEYRKLISKNGTLEYVDMSDDERKSVGPILTRLFEEKA